MFSGGAQDDVAFDSGQASVLIPLADEHSCGEHGTPSATRRWRPAVIAFSLVGLVAIGCLAFSSKPVTGVNKITDRFEPESKATEPVWKLVLRQTHPTRFPQDTWRANADKPHNASYAILDELEQYRRHGGFTFKLSWPSSGLQDQIWKQTSNPVTHKEGGVEGYEPISVPYTANGWGGLEYNKKGDALLDGCVDSDLFFYAVGLHIHFMHGIPGPDIDHIVKVVELYVQVGEKKVAKSDKAEAWDDAAMASAKDMTLGARHAVAENTAERSNECTIMWGDGIARMVSFGFGAYVTHIPVLKLAAKKYGCSLVLPSEIADDWKRWELGPLWTHVMRDEDFKQHWETGQVCRELQPWDSKTNTWKRHMRCEWQEPVANAYDWWGILGCSSDYQDSLLQMFGERLANYKTPFPQYLGMHVRGGDKAKEGKIFPFAEFIAAAMRVWPKEHNVFISTDDSTVVDSQAQPYKEKGYQIYYTSDEARWAGGTPVQESMSEAFRHVHDDSATNAVLDDIMGLARAPLLIGNMGSGFFRLAYMLNERLHQGMERAKPWCIDLLTQQACDARRSIMANVATALDHDFEKADYDATCKTFPASASEKDVALPSLEAVEVSGAEIPKSLSMESSAPRQHGGAAAAPAPCADNAMAAGVSQMDIVKNEYQTNGDGISSWCTNLKKKNGGKCIGFSVQWLSACEKTCHSCKKMMELPPEVARPVVPEPTAPKCYSAPLTGQYCLKRTELQVTKKVNGTKPCQALCDLVSACHGFDFYPFNGACVLFSDPICHLDTSSQTDMIHVMVKPCPRPKDAPGRCYTFPKNGKYCNNRAELLSTTGVKDVQACREKCDGLTNCKGMDYYGFNLGCVLFANPICTPLKLSTHNNVIHQMVGSCDEGCNERPNADVKEGFTHIAGSNVVVQSPADCSSRCTKAATCNVWVFQPSAGTCWLSNQTGTITWERQPDRTGGLRCDHEVQTTFNERIRK